MFSFFRSVFLLLYLLLEMMLFTSAALPAEETQRDVANRVEVPPRILSGAADAAPEPPQNLAVFPQTPTSIMLTWNHPSVLTDLDHYVVYVEGEDMEDTTTNTYYIFYNLEACTDYTFGVLSVSAAGDTSDPLLGEGQTEVGRAVDGAPEPPQDLTFFPQTPTSMMLTWKEPSDLTDLDHYVVYVEDEDMEDTTKDTHYIFNNLEACTDYTFGVMSVSAAGGTSDPLLGEEQTDVGPPPAPQNLQVDGYASTTVTLSWDKPDMLCDVEEYKVKWNTDGANTQSETTSETFFTVTELSQNTSYIFSVSGFTSYGEGDEATVQQTTDVFGGGPPVDLVAVAVSSSAINVSWSPPAEEPLYYLVSGQYCMPMEDMVFGLSYLFTGMDPCETCYIDVISHYKDGSEYTDTVTGTTDGGDPPPPESCSVQVEGDGLAVTWEKPFSDCFLGSFSIHWTGTKLWGDEEQENGNGTTPGTKYTVLGTVPYSLYTFETSSSIDGVFGSPVSCSGTSPEAQPGPPVILAADPGQGGALVVWETPIEENGLIENYGIFVDEETVPNKMVSGDVHNTTLELESCKTFDLSVKAKNGWGWGSPSEVKNVTSEGNGAPPPKSCSVQVEEGALNVEWQEPDTSCPLGLYSYNWTGTKLWGDEEEESGSNTTLGTLFTLPDPVPYSQYTFEISASSNGVFSSPVSCSATSLETEPGPPVILAVDSVKGKAMVTWETPVEENGLIVNYGIFVDEETDPRTTVGGDVHSATLELEPCKTFGLSVEAENGAGWGPPSEMKNVTVVDDDPVPPENCSVQVEESAITVIWERPDNACGLGAYRVDWTNTKLWGSGEVESDGMNTTATNISVVDPVPYCEYFFNVSSYINGVIGNQSATCNGTSLEAPASPPTELVQVAMDVTSVTVQWSIPESLRGRLLGWYLNWTSAIGHYLGEQYVTNPEERMLQIGDLDPSEVYNVYVMAVNGAGKGELAMLEASTEYVP